MGAEGCSDPMAPTGSCFDPDTRVAIPGGGTRAIGTLEVGDEVRFTDASYRLIDSDGARAHVRWSANMAYTLDLGSQTKSGTRPIDTTFELTKFEGTWYLRSAVLPKG